MGASHKRDYKIDVNIQTIKNVIRSRIFLENLKLELRSENLTPNSVWYELHHKMTFTSFGENIIITLTPLGVSSTAVTIHSKCSMPTQVVDWGQNKQNVCSIFENLVSHINRLPTQTVKQPMQPIEQPIQTSTQPINPCFCQHCGAPIGAQAVYCNQCGNKVR